MAVGFIGRVGKNPKKLAVFDEVMTSARQLVLRGARVSAVDAQRSDPSDNLYKTD